MISRDTLQSGINVGPKVINFGTFSRPYSLIKGPMFIELKKKLEKIYIYLQEEGGR